MWVFLELGSRLSLGPIFVRPSAAFGAWQLHIWLLMMHAASQTMIGLRSMPAIFFAAAAAGFFYVRGSVNVDQAAPFGPGQTLYTASFGLLACGAYLRSILRENFNFKIAIHDTPSMSLVMRSSLLVLLLVLAIAYWHDGRVDSSLRTCSATLLLLSCTSFDSALSISEKSSPPLRWTHRLAFIDVDRKLCVSVDLIGSISYLGVLGFWAVFIFRLPLPSQAAVGIVWFTQLSSGVLWVLYAAFSLLSFVRLPFRTSTARFWATALSSVVLALFWLTLSGRGDSMFEQQVGSTLHIAFFDTSQAFLLHCTIHAGLRSGYFRQAGMPAVRERSEPRPTNPHQLATLPNLLLCPPGDSGSNGWNCLYLLCSTLCKAIAPSQF